MPAKNAPDIFQIEDANIPESVNKGVLADMTSYMDTEFAGLDKFLKKYFKIDDKNYAVSSGINGPVLGYNKTKLDQLGIPVPTNNESWDSLLEKCKLATKDTDGDGQIDFWGIQDPITWSTELIRYYFKELETDMYTDDMKATNFDSPKVIEFYHKLSEFRKAKTCVDLNKITLKEGEDPILAGYVAFQPLRIFRLCEHGRCDKG